MSLWDAVGDTPADDLSVHQAAVDYPILEEILTVRPPLPHSTRVASRSSVEQDDSFDPTSTYLDADASSSVVEDQINSSLSVEGGWFRPTQEEIDASYDAPSYDACRFRRDSHCYFPKELNEEATKEAGYEVWWVFDRGTCPRIKWEHQKQCKLYEPGPNTDDPDSLIECTRNWDEGGQRDGVAGPYQEINRRYTPEQS